MDERDRIMIEMLSNSINFYGEARAQASSLHEYAISTRADELAVATQKAIDGLGELISHFSLQQDAIMIRNGAVHIPIKSDREHYEIHFKGIHPKSSPLW